MAEKNSTLNKNNSLMVTSRHNARQYALLTLYEWLLNEKTSVDYLSSCKIDHGNKQVDKNYLKVIVTGTINDISKLEEAITPALDRAISTNKNLLLANIRNFRLIIVLIDSRSNMEGYTLFFYDLSLIHI